MNRRKMLVTGVLGGGDAFLRSLSVLYGSELLVNGDLETWVTDTNAGTWAEAKAGTSAINKESTIKHGGSFSARLDIDASNSAAQLYRDPFAGLTANDWVCLRGWVYSSEAGKTLNPSIGGLSNGVTEHVKDPGPTWTEFITTGQVVGANSVYLDRKIAASAQLYYDDVSLKIITPTSLFGTRKTTPTGDVTAIVNVTVPVGMDGGVAVNMAVEATPFQDVVIGYIHRYNATTCRAFLVKFVSGTRTAVINAAVVTYAANAPLKIVKSGTTYKLYYNDLQVGTDQTISDASVKDNTTHKQFASDPAVQFSNFTAP